MAVSAGRELQECDFHFYVEEEKWNRRNKWVDWNLKFEIKVGLKTFEIGERIVENSGLTGKLTGRLQQSDFHFNVEEEKWNIKNKRVDWNLKLRWARKLLKLVKELLKTTG